MSWDRWKTPGQDGRASMELRERSLWQSALNLRYLPPPIVDLAELARKLGEPAHAAR